ncbi:unnamed protein product [Mytilus coruscus]|uniref:Uncharacterized protein n=1 Tax=Mytilus coruscus TaxID=42192 RepID=A0A6J8BE61_MYTCO|nr:unnamed protein product [Mytilus coruscus]
MCQRLLKSGTCACAKSGTFVCAKLGSCVCATSRTCVCAKSGTCTCAKPGMDEDTANFERNLSGFILSVVYAACSESEADTLSDRQIKTDDTDRTKMETNKERGETASEEERAAVFGSLRNTDLDRLTKAINKTRKQKVWEEEDTASEEERAAFFRSVRSKQLDRLTANKEAVKEINTEMDIETASEEERATFFRNVRRKELDRLTADKGASEEINTDMDIETASEEERAALFRNVRSKELDRLTATLNNQNDEAGNQDVQTEPTIMNKEGLQNQGEAGALDTEETASEEERLDFFQSVREAERKKLVEAFERDKIWKEEREKRRMKKRQEQIKKMFEEFHKPAVSALSASYSSPEQEPGPYNEHYHQYPSNSNTEYNIMLKASVSRLHERVQAFVEEQKELQQKLEETHAKKPTADLEENKENRHISIRASSDAEILVVDRTNEVKRKSSVRRFVDNLFKRSKSTTIDLRTEQVEPEELKLDLGDNKDEDRKEEDTAITSNSEWCTFSDIEDPPRPRLKPFFTLLQERQEITRAHLPGFANLQSDFTSKRSPVKSRTHEPIKRLSTDKNEPTISVSIEIPDRNHSDSTIEYSQNSAGRFQRFRKWFKRLCCCCSQKSEYRGQVCS